MIHKRIEHMRNKKGFTHEEVAVKIGVARPTYSNYESGKREPDLKTVEKLADLFGTNIDYLMGRTNDPTPIGLTKNTDPEMSEILEKLKQKGAELQATAILRTASKMTKRQLEDILRVFEMIEGEEDDQD